MGKEELSSSPTMEELAGLHVAGCARTFRIVEMKGSMV
jgi:hypothetical protein